MQNVVSMVQSSGGSSLLQHAEEKGLDPALLNGFMGIINSAKSGAAGAGEDGADGGGFDLGSVIKMVGGLTNKGSGAAGSEGFIQLLQGGGEGKLSGDFISKWKIVLIQEIASYSGLQSSKE